MLNENWERAKRGAWQEVTIYNLTSFANNTVLGDSKQKATLRHWHELKVLKGHKDFPPDSDVVGVTEATGICGMDALEKEL